MDSVGLTAKWGSWFAMRGVMLSASYGTNLRGPIHRKMIAMAIVMPANADAGRVAAGGRAQYLIEFHANALH
ncbi:hypothetical protein [Sphingomonas sp. NFR04]|uniref:hypothetical protein n=1 Tax=Sphingomonas sp. NFR04 TaxID=1566283 RepID=UPI001113319C|nr:hypothetical protein [Sphingomonas sp. NFR04]